MQALNVTHESRFKNYLQILCDYDWQLLSDHSNICDAAFLLSYLDPLNNAYLGGSMQVQQLGQGTEDPMVYVSTRNSIK